MSDAARQTEQGSQHTPQFQKLAECIGSTPLLDLSELLSPEAQARGIKVVAKAEFMNPGYSIKDRIMQHIFNNAEATGKLRKGMTVVAASSGNTGAATAMLCAMRGYQCIITTNKKCSQEKMDSIKAYGAQLVIGPEGVDADSPEHYMNIPATLLAKEPSKYFDVDQYDNQENPEAYYLTLGPEIWRQSAGTVTHFVAAGSTGGTVSGVGKFLKERSDKVRVVMADPSGSIFKEAYETGKYGKAKKFLVEGVGKDTIPGALNFKVVDEMLEVTDEQAFRMCHRLAQTQGLFVGGSGGLNTHAAVTVAESLKTAGTVVTVLPDTGIKYLSKVYNSEYLKTHGIDVGQPTLGPPLKMAEASSAIKSKL